MRKPDFNQLLKVLNKEVPDRPTLFEFFMNDAVYSLLSGMPVPQQNNAHDVLRFHAKAFEKAGYDYVTAKWPFRLTHVKHERLASISQNEGFVITGERSFLDYRWPDPESYDYSYMTDIGPELPDGMKLIPYCPGGVIENTITLVGFENLCVMIYDNPNLVKQVFDAVGSRLLKYVEIVSQFDTVGAVISNDDWGFHTQTFLSTDKMRELVFPWHKKIVEAIHKNGKKAILHSCGNLSAVMDDVIYDMKFDGKHSYEDSIMPVEEAYERLNGKIAVLGGIDLDFICRSSPEEIKKRCRAMLERTAGRGGYALGTGNSVPSYVPTENYLAMISVINEDFH